MTRYFLWITVVLRPWQCLQSRQHSVSCMAVLHSRWVGHSLCDPSWIIATWFSYCSVNPLRPQNCFPFSPTCRACTNSIAIYLIIMRDFIFLCIGPHQQSAIHVFLLVGCDSWRWQAAEPASWLCNDLSIPCAPENMSHKNIIIYFHIWT